VIAVLAAGCGAVDTFSSGDASHGKALFVDKCGSCHTLANAETKGMIGPNLDEAFRYDRKQGFDESTIRDVVRGQIAYADEKTGTGKPGMPPKLYEGQDARDVATYVAKCAGVPSCGVQATK
jgi:mono/diheme cytochrome c family protein